MIHMHMYCLRKKNSAQELKRFVDTTIIISILKHYVKLSQNYHTIHKQFMAAQMFEAMLHEGDDRGLQME